MHLDGGVFLMGSTGPESMERDGEGPVREVAVQPFSIDVWSVRNADFAAFADATAYVTDAERLGTSFVFYGLVAASARAHIVGSPLDAPWWMVVEGASWRAPFGPGSDVSGLADHPVVHVSHHDALAYCAWAGARLATEAEWEYAARGGLVQKTYPWGDEERAGGRWRCNVWQGEFPATNSMDDGFIGTAPVTAYEPNGYGLYNMVGNVWEWCADPFTVGGSAGTTQLDPGLRVLRGGSYLCHPSYCNRYRVSARTGSTPDSSTGHTGFRCVTAPLPRAG
ncbi:MAG: serine/threonine protein phosphatase [Actinotalea sp.]|nr:serine/threonine protein phosphatase [Actinotalea sp.]